MMKTTLLFLTLSLCACTLPAVSDDESSVSLASETSTPPPIARWACSVLGIDGDLTEGFDALGPTRIMAERAAVKLCKNSPFPFDRCILLLCAILTTMPPRRFVQRRARHG